MKALITVTCMFVLVVGGWFAFRQWYVDTHCATILGTQVCSQMTAPRVPRRLADAFPVILIGSFFACVTIATVLQVKNARNRALTLPGEREEQSPGRVRRLGDQGEL